MDLLLNHVSVRNFRNEDVPAELINRLIASGIRASTTGNMQWYSVIVTREHNLKDRINALHFNQKAAVTAPVILTFCADINRFNIWCRLNKAEPGYDNFISFFNAATDALLAAQNVCIAAENCGMGICYLGTALYNAAEIIELLNLPEYVVPVTAVALGWPEYLPELTDRLPPEAVIHNESYKDFTDDMIRHLYSEKENLEDSKRFVLENGLETLAQVYTNVRYKKGDNEYFSDKLLNTLRQQGFKV